MNDELRKKFAANLKKALAEAGKNQTDMANYMNVSTATASEWCSGKKMPRADKIQSLCNWLHIELSDLLEDYDPDIKIDPRTIALQKAFDDRPEMRVLFSVAESATKEDIERAIKIIEALKGEDDM